MIGCTVSTVGGLLKGITRAAEFGYDCIQIYTSKSRCWDVSPLAPTEAKIIRDYSIEKKVQLIAHVPFLVNLSSPDIKKRQMSFARMEIEIKNASLLGIHKIILHPGNVIARSSDTYEAAFRHLIWALDNLADMCSEHFVTILLETMSGQGTELGMSFDELKFILSTAQHPETLGICFDTAHVFASGYDISSVEGLNKTLQIFDKEIGIHKIGCFHLNNTKVSCGKRVDRHSSIFDGNIAIGVFEELIKTPHYTDVPKIIEPPASDGDSIGYIQTNHLITVKNEAYMKVDNATEQYFNGKVKQVFVYLTNRCQLRCRQCLYKPLLDDNSSDLDLASLIQLLQIFRRYGAYKLSFLGGEPTLYIDSKSGADFSKVVEISKELGYSYIRVDTNGQFPPAFLANKSISKLDEITFSIDGYDAPTHDALRGKGTFNKCISNIKQAVNQGYKVQITSCFHNGLCVDVATGVESILKLISLCDEIKVQKLNFHPILKVGVKRDDWIDNTEISSALWIEIYEEVQNRLRTLSSNIAVRLPMRYVKKEMLSASHSYCPLKMGERALIMPDGTIKVCAFNIGTPNCLAKFTNTCVAFEDEHNELSLLERSGIMCCNQQSSDEYYALCMSYKPNQSELVWNNYLETRNS